ncbi:POU domain, class 5, transcription factor 1.2-like [Pelobates fuscus]|uniref:POU domain, class 5, transcription factor 1.2-like n=1 Tax=Pelobates fuscus TaxID=191477 RepID=UPI002FE44E73
MNRPTSPQTMIYAAQGGQVMYPMHHYQKPSPARISTDGSCTSTSTISTAGSCTPAAGTISMDASCTSTSTISQVPTGRVVSDDEDKSSMSELEKFAQDTKRRRLRMGFTQENVGNGLGALYNNRFSQTTVCRFEAGQLSLANMRKLKPIINKWLDEVESNAASRAIVNDGEKLKNYGKRKRRTFIQAATKSYLELCYEQCPHPTKSDIEIISEKSKMEYEVIRIWFCNRRQKSKKELDKCLKEQTITFGNFAQPIPASNTGNWVMPPMAVPQPWLLDMAASNHTPYMATNNQNGQFIQHAMQRMPPGNYTQ